MTVDWAPAGWYPDPSRTHESRYYDGAAWTDHVAQGVAGSPAATEMKAARWVAVGLAAFGLLQALAWGG